MKRLMKFLKEKKDTKLELLPAWEAYEQAAEPQWENYLRKIKEAKEMGKQSCYLLCGDLELLREEHKNKLLAAGYDLSIKISKDSLLERRVSVQCFWDESASGEIREYKNDFESELPMSF